MSKFEHNKPMKLGFKALPHAKKMAAKKAHRAELAKLALPMPRQFHIRSMVSAMKAVNKRNGVGRPPLPKRFLVSREVA